MIVEIEFKPQESQQLRLKKEFRAEITGMLRAVLLDLAFFTWSSFHIKLLITCLIRTKAENKKINGRPYSAHIRGDAGDSRSWIFTKDQIAIIEKYLKHTWGDIVHFKYHDAGSGAHMHINVNWPYHKKPFKNPNKVT